MTKQLLLIGAGGYLIWFGISRFRKEINPFVPIKNLLQGKGLNG